MGERIPEKHHYKLGEVCQIADTQPYVLRFWESEFPQLRPGRSRTGHPVYTRTDLDLVLRIKRLLHDDELTLADARRQLEHADEPAETSARAGSPGAPDPTRAPASTPPRADETVATLEEELEATRRRLGEMRDRYDEACREIRRLRDVEAEHARVVQEREREGAELAALREQAATLDASRREVAGRNTATQRLEARLAAAQKERRRLAQKLAKVLDAFLELTAGERGERDGSAHS